MFKRRNSNLIPAVGTGCAVIAFAFFQAHVNVSSTTLDVAAATICILPAVFGLAWRKSCRNKMSNAR
jgi:hypothetical protein